MTDQLTIGDILSAVMGKDIGPLVNTASFEFEITARQADELIGAYMETRAEVPDEVFTVFHAIVCYATAVSEAGLANFRATGRVGLSDEDVEFTGRVKGVLSALNALNYDGKVHSEKVNASIGPKVNEPGVAIVRISI